jgi:hypothetical protein
LRVWFVLLVRISSYKHTMTSRTGSRKWLSPYSLVATFLGPGGAKKIKRRHSRMGPPISGGLIVLITISIGVTLVL